MYSDRIHHEFMNQTASHLRQGVELPPHVMRRAKMKRIRKLARYYAMARFGYSTIF